MKRTVETMLCLAVLCISASAQTEQRTLALDVNKLGIEISPTLSGIFFEDINQSLDGGICAQMIQNNSFQAYNVPDGPANEFLQSDTVFFGWTVVQTDGAVGEAHAVSNRALLPADVLKGGEADTKVYTSTTIDTKTGRLYLKFVNAEAADKRVTISITGGRQYDAEMEYMTSADTSIKNQGDANYYSSHPDVDSSFSYHEAITPQTQRLGKVSDHFTIVMPQNAVGIVRLK